MGRARTLLGTKPAIVRLPVGLLEALDAWAREEKLSRNTLVSRELASAVTQRSQRSSRAHGGQASKRNPD